ncbi:hypothetical protein CR513_34676, partial [Mucuna pruriens]
MGVTSTKEVWCTLKDKFQGSVKVCVIKLQILRHKFELIKMKESKIVKDYYSKIKEKVMSLRTIKINILHVTFARRQVTCKRIIGIVENLSVNTARNLDMWRRTITKISSKQILLKNMAINNIFSMLPKIPINHMVKDKSMFKEIDNSVEVIV